MVSKGLRCHLKVNELYLYNIKNYVYLSFLYFLMYFVLRDHMIPVGYEDVVRIWYIRAIRAGHVPSPLTIDFEIRKRCRREDVWEEHSFMMQLPDESMMMLAVESESMDQYWKDKKPEGDYEVHGKMTESTGVCSICLCCKGLKLQLSCNCMFHKSCIEKWARYKKTCPKCFLPINTTSRISIPCNENVSEENPH